MSDLIKRLRSQESVDARPYEIERLTDEAADALEAANERIAALVDRAERNEVDAARYQLVRAQHWSDSNIAVVLAPKKSVKLGSDCPSEQRLDEIVDAMLAGRDANIPGGVKHG